MAIPEGKTTLWNCHFVTFIKWLDRRFIYNDAERGNRVSKIEYVNDSNYWYFVKTMQAWL